MGVAYIGVCGRRLRCDETELIVLCEGDRTFRAYDLDKFIAYAPHADIVNGTRTVERLRQHQTQLSTFMYYGNLFVGKLLEARHLGKCTITDVGTTYKLCRRQALRQLLPTLDPSVNLEFNAYFLDKALASGWLWWSARSPSISAWVSARAATPTTGARSRLARA